MRARGRCDIAMFSPLNPTLIHTESLQEPGKPYPTTVVWKISNFGYFLSNFLIRNPIVRKDIRGLILCSICSSI